MLSRPGKACFLLISAAIILIPGYSRIQQLRQKNRELAEKIEAIEDENRRLKKEITLLETDPVYIEEVAREELGLAGENEIIFRVIREDND